MILIRRKGEDLPLWAVFLFFLFLPVMTFWRSNLFFNGDDWIILLQIVDNTFWYYIFGPDTEHWFPFFKFTFYILLKIIGSNYAYLVLINCLLTGVLSYLVFLFFRRFFNFYQALTLSLVYLLSSAHTTNIWTAQNITLIISLGFFLTALIQTDIYWGSPQLVRLIMIGCCSLLSILSNNFILLGLLSIPLYAAIHTREGTKGKVGPLAAVIGLVYMVFIVGYSKFAGMGAAASQNHLLFTGIPGAAYLIHFFFSAFLSPFLYLFWGHYHFPFWTYISGISLMTSIGLIIWRYGEGQEKRLACWLLVLNSLPFLLASLVRYQRSIYQAFAPRYAVFTLIGSLMLVGIAWRIIARRYPGSICLKISTTTILCLIFWGQIQSIPKWYKAFQAESQASLNYYQSFPLNAPRDISPLPDQKQHFFMPERHPGLTLQQQSDIRRFLSGLPPG